mmetsp:Transcript_63369/g.196309  ORF Transcript_63369/g.196309 Transcript_63369/m.196309 type:complete len:273 (+) Transcript_63369:771-1589(+)
MRLPSISEQRYAVRRGHEDGLAALALELQSRRKLHVPGHKLPQLLQLLELLVRGGTQPESFNGAPPRADGVDVGRLRRPGLIVRVGPLRLRPEGQWQLHRLLLPGPLAGLRRLAPRRRDLVDDSDSGVLPLQVAPTGKERIVARGGHDGDLVDATNARVFWRMQVAPACKKRIAARDGRGWDLVDDNAKVLWPLQVAPTCKEHIAARVGGGCDLCRSRVAVLGGFLTKCLRLCQGPVAVARALLTERLDCSRKARSRSAYDLQNLGWVLPLA